MWMNPKASVIQKGNWKYLFFFELFCIVAFMQIQDSFWACYVHAYINSCVSSPVCQVFNHYYVQNMVPVLIYQSNRSETNLDRWFSRIRQPRSFGFIQKYFSPPGYKYHCFFCSKLTGSIHVFVVLFYSVTPFYFSPSLEAHPQKCMTHVVCILNFWIWIFFNFEFF